MLLLLVLLLLQLILMLLQLFRTPYTHATGYGIGITIIIHIFLLGTCPFDKRFRRAIQEEQFGEQILFQSEL